MARRELLSIDPRTLRVSPQRLTGADPAKLHRQIAKHGSSIDGMPTILVLRGKDGELQIMDGMTRATRVAKLLPGTMVTVEVVDRRPKHDLTRYPTIGDTLP